MPPQLVVELDLAIAAQHPHNIHWSRADTIAVAVRRFLNQSGMELTPATPDGIK